MPDSNTQILETLRQRRANTNIHPSQIDENTDSDSSENNEENFYNDGEITDAQLVFYLNSMFELVDDDEYETYIDNFNIFVTTYSDFKRNYHNLDIANIHDRFGFTMMHRIVQGDLQLFAIFLCNAEGYMVFNGVDDDGESAIAQARRLGRDEIVRIIEESERDHIAREQQQERIDTPQSRP